MAESGWYPDPNSGELERYWDGNAWSTSTRPRAAAEPVYQPGFPAAPANQGYQGYPNPQQTGQYVPFGTQAQVGTVGATWGQRLLAYLIDAAIGVGPFVIAYAIFVVTLGASSASDNVGPAAIGLLAVAVGGLWAVGFFIYNVLIRQGNTGQTIGKSKIGLRLVTEATGSPPGLGMSLARYFTASLISSLTCGIFGVLDYLWPLWDPRRQRIVDKWFHLMVVDLKQG